MAGTLNINYTVNTGCLKSQDPNSKSLRGAFVSINLSCVPVTEKVPFTNTPTMEVLRSLLFRRECRMLVRLHSVQLCA